jgi:hypothetical protein
MCAIGKATRIMAKIRCKSNLLIFVNAGNSKQAFQLLSENLKGKIAIAKPTPEILKQYYDSVVKLFTELSKTTSLFDCPSIDEFTAYYSTVLRPGIDVQYDGTLGETAGELFTEEVDLFDLLSYCVIQVLKKERNIRLIYKCENEKCSKFFFAKRVKPKGVENGIRYCSDGCRYAAHNKRKTESEYFKNYKRAKRKDKDSPLSYFGYKKEE